MQRGTMMVEKITGTQLRVVGFRLVEKKGAKQ